MSLMPRDRRRQLLERGLLAGYWSISQFNRGLHPYMEPTLPDWDFLDAHPEFTDMDHRDLAAFRSREVHDSPF